jgi:hypothetical protein
MNVHSNHMKSNLTVQQEITILVFRTNLRFSKDVRAVGARLQQLPGIIRWNVDRQDVDKVLRIETTCPDVEAIIALVQQAGYCCEELPD